MNARSPLQQYLFETGLNDLMKERDNAAQKAAQAERQDEADQLEKIREIYKVFKCDIEKIVEIKTGKIIYQNNKETKK